MKRIIGSEASWPWILFAVLAVGTVAGPTILALVFAPQYGFLTVPVASWLVLALAGWAVVFATATGAWLWRQLRRAEGELADRTKQPLESPIPAVYGYKLLDQAEFLPIIQTLFTSLAGTRFIQARPLPGGHGGSKTVQVELQRAGDDAPLPRSFVVKLGDRREMAGEYDKFQTHARWHLSRAARFFRHAEWGDLAGIAYEFVGLDPAHEIQSLHQFYAGHAAVETSELINQVYAHLGQAWYRNGQIVPTDLYREYGLLNRKAERIIGHVGEIVDEGDEYRLNFAGVEERLRPHLKPAFCPDPDIPWHDPVAFIRAWLGPRATVPVHRSTVHGDLHAQNVLVEIARNGQKHVWFIDFSHTGNGLSQARTAEAAREGALVDPHRGHTLRDFCRLEADVKFILTRLSQEEDLALAVAFERELLAGGMAPADWSQRAPPVEGLQEERFRKAWQVVREIRRQAAAHLARPDDLRPYYFGLLHATLPIVYYHPEQFAGERCERIQKRYALLAAGMACSQL